MGKKHSSIGLWNMKTMLHCSVVMFLVGGLATLVFYRNNNQEQVISNVKVTLTTKTTTTMITERENMNTNINTRPFDHQRRLKIAPQFDGKAIVERLKGKRLLFVGDSVNRNQWDSMMCMLHSSIPGKKRVSMGGLNGTLYTFRATDYNISIDYYWAPMLVESNGDDPSNHRLDHRTIRIEAIEKHGQHWVDADILVFNTYLWWRLPIIKFLKSAGSLLGGPNQVYDEVDNVRAYKKVLETWSKWVRVHIDPAKTKMFFMGLTATHSRATDWGGKKDAHPTVHRKLWRPLTDAQKKNPQRASDCTHWCLPGVPDIWNELLLAYIFPVTETTSQ
ncbi:hypothetical protein L2E82_51939 [Cichorium intybus]|nr:hypothetical protein L2E82_51939 [Cichorium intybus]